MTRMYGISLKLKSVEIPSDALKSNTGVNLKTVSIVVLLQKPGGD